MPTDVERRAAEHEAGEVIKVATDLMESDRARREEPDVHAIGEELGVPRPYVDRAVAELERRRVRRRIRFALAACFVLAVSLVAWRTTRPTKSPEVTSVAPGKPVTGLTVAFDLRHGIGTATGAKELESRGAKVLVMEQPLDAASLKGVDVLVLLEARRLAQRVESDAIVAFVREGHGLVVADLGWSWVTYDKKPLEDMPANVIGSQLGFGFTNDVAGSPTSFDSRDLGGITAIARNSQWVPCGIIVAGDRGRVLVRDDHLRPVVGAVDAGKGHVAVFGHASIPIDNPQLLAFAVALSAGR